jgi:uridine kinase
MGKSIHIAVIGGSGSGKTWLAQQLCSALGQTARLSLDEFFRDLSHLTIEQRSGVNFDDPDAIDWASARPVMERLLRGETASVPVYDFTTHTRCREFHLFPAEPIVIWDGLWLLHDEWMRERFACSIFVDCSAAERLTRRVTRDVRDRGRTENSVRRQFQDHVQPMHERFVEPQRTLATHCVTSPLDGQQFEALLREVRAAISNTRILPPTMS